MGAQHTVYLIMCQSGCPTAQTTTLIESTHGCLTKLAQTATIIDSTHGYQTKLAVATWVPDKANCDYN